MDLKRYQEAAKDNIEYDATEKSYVATRNFRPLFLRLSPERFLLQLQALKTGAIQKLDTWFDEVPNSDVTPTMVRGPEAFTLRAIVQAIESQSAIQINYKSLTSTGVRTICPHAFAHDGYRWHVRALSVEKLEYRDYVLGRILSISQPVECNADPSDDLAWNTEVDLIVSAHPGLSSAQKETIEYDYRLDGGSGEVTMRLALAYYFIKRYNLDLRKGQISPERAQLFLENYEEVEEALKAVQEESKRRIAAGQSHLQGLLVQEAI